MSHPLRYSFPNQQTEEWLSGWLAAFNAIEAATPAAEPGLDRLMELWQQPWSEAAYGEAQMLLARLRTASTELLDAGLQLAQRRLSEAGMHDAKCPEPDQPCTCGIDKAIFGRAKVVAPTSKEAGHGGS